MALTTHLSAQKQYPYTVAHQKPHYEIFDTNFVVNKNAFGGSINLGYGLNFNNISHYFSNPILIGLSMDFYIKKFIIQVEGSFGLSKTKQEMLFDKGRTWAKDKAVLSGHYGGNMGVCVIDNRYVLWAVTGGIGVKTMTSNLLFGKEISNNEPLLPFYKVGFYVDLKPLIILNSHIRVNNKDTKYSCVRLMFNYEGAIGKPKYSEYFYGNMLYFTLRIGSLSRSYHTKYNAKKIVY